MLLKDALPEIAIELARGFDLADRADLAKQIAWLELLNRCPCDDEFCATFYTQPNKSWEGREVERFILNVPGLTSVHVVEGIVARVELLWRPAVRNRLRELFPPVVTSS